ncbi:hypothetical protein DNJ99_23505 [Pseudomonas daroniae]|nr:hypothetical protein DNJ99_23505 [Pseudomonas daroniae]
MRGWRSAAGVSLAWRLASLGRRLSWAGPSCYDERPRYPWGKDAVFNHKRVAETKGYAPAVAEHVIY